jgi:hypothetical protein
MITAEKINKVQDKIKAAILKIQQEENVKIKFGTCRYNDVSYKSTMEVISTAKNEKTQKATNNQNLVLSKQYGFDFNIIGKKVRMNNGMGIITEFKTRNRKYPIIVDVNGKSYKMDIFTAKRRIVDYDFHKRNENVEQLLK